MSGGPTTGIRFVAAAAVSLAALLAVGGGHAQTLRPTVLNEGPLPQIRPRDTTRLQPPRAEPVAEDEPQQVSQPGRATSARPPAVMRGTLPDRSLPGDQQASALPSEAPASEQPAGPGLDEPEEEESALQRLATINQPPADFDPELFQAEVEPILDRRPARLYRFEPWQQRGIRVGSFLALPEIEAGAAWLTNVLRSTPARADGALYVRPSLRMRSEWRAHALEFAATGNVSEFAELSSENDRAYRLEARGRLDITRRTNVEVLGSHELSQEARGRVDTLASARGRSDITTDRAAAAFNTRFNRLTLQLRGAITNQDYGDNVSGFDDPGRDVTIREQAVRVGWEFKPALAAFAEIVADQRAHAAPSRVDGIRRDSDGERYRLGLGFGNRGNVVRGEVSVGWARQSPEDARLGGIEGMIVDANLAWRIDGLNAVLLQARSDITETTLAGSSGALARSAGIEWRHAFRRALIGSAGVAYAVRDYQGVTVSESDVAASIGIEYYLGPEAMVFGRYEHIEYQSSVPGGDWSSDEVRVGVRVRR